MRANNLDMAALVEAPFFVFDVEAVGLFGQPFAVAGGVYIDGAARSEFRLACPREVAEGALDDRDWINKHVPHIDATHACVETMLEAFWQQWTEAVSRYPDIKMAAECLYPVEAGLVLGAVTADQQARKWGGPYPFHEIASIMLAAGMDPMATYERRPGELPAHEPLADARQSARLLAEALRRLSTLHANDHA